MIVLSTRSRAFSNCCGILTQIAPHGIGIPQKSLRTVSETILPVYGQARGNDSMRKDFLNVNELSEQWGYTTTTIRKWARQGKIPAIKIGDDWRFTEGLTFPFKENTIDGMGRRKRGYSAPHGLIKRTGSPYWWIKWKGIYRSTETHDLTKAHLQLIEEQRKYLQTKTDDKSLKFSHVLSEYLTKVSKEKRSHKSEEVNSRRPLEYLGEMRIESITPQDVYAFRNWRKGQKHERADRPIKESSVNRELALIRNVFSYAIEQGYVATSPAKEVKRFSEVRRERYITDEEFTAIKGRFYNPDLLDALYFTGQRSGRIFKLQWSQIDLDKRNITFKQTSKNKKVPDIIWVNDALYAILVRLKADRAKKAVSSIYVFPNRQGRGIGSIKTAWNKACEKLGIQDATPHDLRHKCVTDMRKAGIQPDKAMKAVGHSNFTTSLNYTHWGMDDIRQAFDALQQK